ncbi:alpha-E domain-containing protein [Megalodesulfovibrio paquesii]
MLSRVAESIYWMSRNLERAENVARFIEVNWHLSLDLPVADLHSDQPAGDCAEDGGGQWRPLVMITGDQEWFDEHYPCSSREHVIQFLAFDEEYPNSIRNCLRYARENARTVRDTLPPEMWEQLNTFYHQVEDMARAPEAIFSNPYYFCETLKMKCLLLIGLAESGMRRGEGWHFFNLGRMLERADKTSRILDVKYFILLPDLAYVGSALDDIQWAALLRSTSAFEEYRHHYGRIRPRWVAEFLLLDRCFPRAALFCLQEALRSLQLVDGTPDPSAPETGRMSEPERVLGRLVSRLLYATMESLFKKGLHESIDALQVEINHVHDALVRRFFAIPCEEEEVCEPDISDNVEVLPPTSYAQTQG